MPNKLTNPRFINNTWVFGPHTWEEQKAIAAYNWKAIGLLADELAKRRMVTLSLPEADREDDINDSFDRFLP